MRIPAELRVKLLTWRDSATQMWRRTSRPRLFAYALVIVGAGLLGYVSVEYWSMYSSQRELSHQFAEQQEGAAAQQNAQVTAERSTTPKLANGLMRLSIAKIDLDAIVVEGSNRRALMRGPGHLELTAYPGDQGNVVITAHRDTFFRHIYELNKGDQIQVQRGGMTFLYEVTGKKIVEPTDVSVAAPTKEARLTLITCYPTYFIGPAPERLVVFARLVSSSGEGTLEKTAAQAGSPH